MTAGRMGVIARPTTAFNILTGITWSHAYWAEGPEFVATSPTNNATVANWPDEIGTADAVQATELNKPLYRSADGPNSKPTLQGDGNDVMVATFGSAETQPTTIVAVGSTPQTSGNRFMYDGLNGTDRNALFRSSDGSFRYTAGTSVAMATANTAGHLWINIYNGASSEGHQDGTLYAGSAGTAQIGGLTIFASNSNTLQWFGFISFIGVYNGVMSAPDIAAVEAWAASHYGLTIV